MPLLTLQDHGFVAIIDTCGSHLNPLTYNGRDLIEPKPNISRFHGSVLAPWPNRIADGKYQFRGRSYSVEVNEVQRHNALHGLVTKLEWAVTKLQSNSLVLTLNLPASKGYPWPLALTSSFNIEKDGMRWRIEAINVGVEVAPYGVSIHPYLVTGNGSAVDDFYLQFDSDEFLEVDDERLLPLEFKDVHSRNFNFKSRSKIGERFLDHAFKIPTNLKSNRITVTDENGVGSFMEFDDKARWIQIHTADRDGGPGSRRCLAVEPMSCPPDAFNSGLDLIELEPGQIFSMSWLIGPIQ
jgi:aldose 1-epimerase